MLDSLITSKTRIKLLLKFFLNTSTHAYLRGLADEFGESTNALRLELNHLENAGLLKAENKGNRKVYHANSAHPLFNDIHRLVLKHSGITQVIEEVVERVGDISKVWVRGDFAVGKDSDLIDLVIAGKNIDVDYFENLIQKVGKIVKRQICYTIILPKQYFIKLIFSVFMSLSNFDLSKLLIIFPNEKFCIDRCGRLYRPTPFTCY